MWRGHRTIRVYNIETKINRLKVTELRESLSFKGSIRSKYIKGSKERYLLGQDKASKCSGLIPFVELQNDTSTTAKQFKTTKNEKQSKPLICFWLSYIVFLSSAWKNVPPEALISELVAIEMRSAQHQLLSFVSLLGRSSLDVASHAVVVLLNALGCRLTY